MHNYVLSSLIGITGKMTSIVSKTKNRVRALLLLIPVLPATLAIALIVGGFSSAHTIDLRRSPEVTAVAASDLPAVPLVINEPVQREIDQFTATVGGRYTMEKWLSRSGKYFPMMRKIFAEERVPQELIYLSMIESGLNPVVASGAKAVGLWQFIQATGSAYGLRANAYTDDRRDPVEATHAAARLLRDLYNTMGDWHLALSTYNCSMGAIKRAMVKMGDTTYWGIRSAIPRETADYVPRYIAVAIIASNPEKYGFTNIWYEQPAAYDTVQVKGSFDLNTLAVAAGVSALEVKVLNPELLQQKTPPTSLTGAEGYTLKVPAGTQQKFYANFGKAPKPVLMAKNADRLEEMRMMQAGL
jgi:membrane-bound lytic murein transglycosylase D